MVGSFSLLLDPEWMRMGLGGVSLTGPTLEFASLVLWLVFLSLIGGIYPELVRTVGPLSVELG